MADTEKPEYVCPNCGNSEFKIDVVQEATVQFGVPNEDNDFTDHEVVEQPEGDILWDDSSECSCTECGFAGTLKDMKKEA